MLIYDGTFEGFLTALWAAYQFQDFSGIAEESKYQKSLFDEPHILPTNEAQASRVTAKLQELEIFFTVQDGFLSGDADKENILLAYVRQTLQAGRNLDKNFADPIVGAALECVRRVWREAHRLKGLLRFQELTDGSFYAACEPDHCVLPLLSEHYLGRFGAQDWFIHDARRNMILFCRDRKINFLSAANIQNVRDKYAGHEQNYQELWKTFWRNVAIAERKNPKLQKQFMPQRYWKYLVEKN